ncbi:MAG: c-type cytochrome [bacterium]
MYASHTDRPVNVRTGQALLIGHDTGNPADNAASDILSQVSFRRIQMKNWVGSVAVAAMLSAGAVSGAFAQAKAAPASAASGKDLLAKSGCLACHAADKKVVGPSYIDVANKYRSVKGAEDKITAHVLNGGGGVWGQIAMPPHKHIPEADIRSMVRFILATK